MIVVAVAAAELLQRSIHHPGKTEVLVVVVVDERSCSALALAYFDLIADWGSVVLLEPLSNHGNLELLGLAIAAVALVLDSIGNRKLVGQNGLVKQVVGQNGS